MFLFINRKMHGLRLNSHACFDLESHQQGELGVFVATTIAAEYQCTRLHSQNRQFFLNNQRDGLVFLYSQLCARSVIENVVKSERGKSVVTRYRWSNLIHERPKLFQ